MKLRHQHIYQISALISIILVIFAPMQYNAIYTQICCYFSLFMIILFIYHQKKYVTKNWFDPSILFLIAYIIVFIQAPLKYVFDMPIITEMKGFNFFSKNYVTLGSAISLMGLTCFFCGYWMNFSKTLKKEYSSPETPEDETAQLNNIILNKTRRFSLNIAVLFLILLLIFGNKTFLGGGYGTELGFMGELSYSFLNLFSITSFALTGYNSYLKGAKNIVQYIKFYDLKTMVFFIAIVLLFLNIGVRSAYIAWFIAFFTPYFICIRPLKHKTFIFIVLVAFVFFAWSAAFRVSKQMKFSEKVENASLILENIKTSGTAFGGNLYFGLTLELEHSYLTFNEILYQTEKSKTTHKFGMGWIITIASSIIPLSGNLITTIFEVQPNQLSSSVYLSNIVFGKKLEGGTGSTILGDIIFNFGIWGVPIFMFSFGFFVGYITERINHLNLSAYFPIYLSIFSYLISISFLICRNEFTLGWSVYIRIFILLYLINIFLNYQNTKKKDKGEALIIS